MRSVLPFAVLIACAGCFSNFDGLTNGAASGTETGGTGTGGTGTGGTGTGGTGTGGGSSSSTSASMASSTSNSASSTSASASSTSSASTSSTSASASASSSSASSSSTAGASSSSSSSGAGGSSPVSGIKELATGSQHACAILDDGTIRCWGYQWLFATGTTSDASIAWQATPIPALSSSRAVRIAAGFQTTCAVMDDMAAGKSLWCWGWNSTGQLGLGFFANEGTLMEVTELEGEVEDVTLGASFDNSAFGGGFGCARLTNGTVQCWGSNWSGSLGDGTTMDHASPAEVPGLTNVVQIAGQHDTQTVCARVDSAATGKKVFCWGNGVLTPTEIPSLAGADDIAVGSPANDTSSERIFARVGASILWSGPSSPGPFAAAQAYQGLPPNVTVTQMAVSDVFCAVLSDGSVRCAQFSPSEVPEGLTKVTTLGPGTSTEVRTGDGFRCASLTQGGVSCWGDNSNGALGNDVSLAILAPTKVLPGPATGLASGMFSNAAIQGGAVVAWGSDDTFGASVDLTPRVTKVSGTGFMGLGGGYPGNDFGAYVAQAGGMAFVQGGSPGSGGHLLGTLGLVKAYPGYLRDAGVTNTFQVVVYNKDSGANDHGTNGTGDIQTMPNTTINVPTALADGVATYPSADHLCAWNSTTGMAWCWGLDDNGQVDGVGPNDRLAPVHLTFSGNPVTEMAIGKDHSCAIVNDPSKGKGVWCWGSPSATGLNTSSITAIGRAADHVVCGGSHTCAWVQDGPAFCWGANGSGQLGSGDLTDASNPQMVLDASMQPLSVKTMSAGDNHTCALVTDGSVSCWGDQSLGQVGNGVLSSYDTPQAVVGLSP